MKNAKKGKIKNNEKLQWQVANRIKKMLNPAGEYAVKFAENHGMSISDALEQPMVKARLEFFNQTGK